MARSRRKPENRMMPGLFDSLDNFQERADGDFRIIPPDKMRDIAERYSERHEADSEIDRMKPIERESKLLFMSFGSGSSGNCSYVGTAEEGVLVDAGVDPETVLSGMRANGLSMSAVKAILLTHDHGDHIRYAYQMLRKYRRIALMCTPRVLNGILRRHNVSRRIKDYHNPIYKEFTITVARMEVTPFEVFHDGMDNAGFFFRYGDKTLTIATDLGHISARVDHYMRLSTAIVIEANYDRQMLADGPYPEYLKARIMSNTGHLDNAVTAEFISGIYTPSLTHVFLCHLSHENNTPELAVGEMVSALARVGVTLLGDGLDPLAMPRPQLNLIALPRQSYTHLYIL